MRVFVNDFTVTIIHQGNSYSGELDMDRLRTFKEMIHNREEYTPMDFIHFINPEIAERERKRKAHEAFLASLEDNELFTVTDKGTVQLRDIPVDMPDSLVKRIAEIGDDEFALECHLNFWRWCSLNPDPQARHDLFGFLDKYGFAISEQGFFVAFRNADVKQQGNEKLTRFVSSEYVRISQTPEGRPAMYDVYEFGGGYVTYNSMWGRVTHGNLVGNLDDLYQSLGQDSETGTVFTDTYSRSTVIKIGVPVDIPREDCNADPEVTCSYGLHVAGADWLSNGAFGGTSLMVLVNPMNVVAVPHADNYGKMRTCEYMPIAIIERDDDGNIIFPDVRTFSFDYSRIEVDRLQHMLSGDVSFTDDDRYANTIAELFGVEGKTYADLMTLIEEANTVVTWKNVDPYVDNDEWEDEDEDWD